LAFHLEYQHLEYAAFSGSLDQPCLCLWRGSLQIT